MPIRTDRDLTDSRMFSPVALIIAVIRMYQRVVSPLFPPSCRFTPTCSQYSIEALRAHGLMRGVWLSTGRLLRCHPFHPGGEDRVPRHGTLKERKHGPKDDTRRFPGNPGPDRLSVRVCSGSTEG